MRTLARKVIVDSITPIENADLLELAHVGGWQIVVQKGALKQGDTAVYFEIDSALPVADGRYAFLKDRCLKVFTTKAGQPLDKCIRIKTIKLRGCLSQGLLLSATLFPELEEVPIGDDCTELLKVRHYDELWSMYGSSAYGGMQKGNFPTFIPKTDEERIQNLPAYFKTLQDAEFEVTRKVDGSSMTVFYAAALREDSPFGVCSRNFELKLEDETSDFVKAACAYNLEEILKASYENDGYELALQGELNGPGVNGNRDLLKAINFKVFRIFNITKQCFLSPQARLNWCAEYAVPHVPVMERYFKPFRVFSDMDALLAFSDGLTENGQPREGLVYKEEDTEHPVTFKAVSNAYLMKEK